MTPFGIERTTLRN